MRKRFEALGLMSGTSMDGLDIALCEFRMVNYKWEFGIIQAETIQYSPVWLQILKEAPFLDGLSLTQLNVSFGHWMGQTALHFIEKFKAHPRIIASHGHTIFHRPNDHMTLQIGSGAAIAAETGIITVSDFRAMDIALGGQGAPLVPIGDKLLFESYSACLNIGGFANISYEKEGGRIAYDICPANIILNMLSAKMGFPFDPSGINASQGNCNATLLKKLDAIDYYKQSGPKSLGREWVERVILPILNDNRLEVKDLLSTFTQHIANQICRNLPRDKKSITILSGGGTHNLFLVNLVKKQALCTIEVPDQNIVDYKESLIFAFLGMLRMEGINNCLAEATGAVCDSSGGVIHLPPSKKIKR